MNDVAHAGTFFLIFAAALIGYGAILVRTGDKNLLPRRAVHSVRNSDEVRRVGRIVICVGAAIAVAALMLRLLGGWTS